MISFFLARGKGRNTTFFECLLNAVYCGSGFHKSLCWLRALLPLFHRWWNWYLLKFSNFPSRTAFNLTWLNIFILGGGHSDLWGNRKMAIKVLENLSLLSLYRSSFFSPKLYFPWLIWKLLAKWIKDRSHLLPAREWLLHYLRACQDWTRCTKKNLLKCRHTCFSNFCVRI